MRTYCFIFARGGSKGIPNKNIIDFGGLPLIIDPKYIDIGQNQRKLRDELKKEGYRFETGSDTEVLIKVLDCWGEKGINKLEGMWAFYYFNHKKKIGILSRDRFGEKPLYYGWTKMNNYKYLSELFLSLIHI